jgi:hypothetical protein
VTAPCQAPTDLSGASPCPLKISWLVKLAILVRGQKSRKQIGWNSSNMG